MASTAVLISLSTNYVFFTTDILSRKPVRDSELIAILLEDTSDISFQYQSENAGRSVHKE
jgi:hypothetical protein